jgi:hypothetical protein
MNPHLEPIPSIGTLTTGGFTGGNLEFLGGETYWSGNVEFFVKGSLFEVGADLFEVLDVAGGEGDADAMDLGGGVAFDSFFFAWGDVGGHDGIDGDLLLYNRYGITSDCVEGWDGAEMIMVRADSITRA